MITCIILKNGDLKITAANETRTELKHQLETNGYWSTISTAFESYSTNGSFTPFDAAAGMYTFVGLTSAPCIAESLTIEDNGSTTIIGRLWAFCQYQIKCDLTELINTGKVVYTLI